MTYITKKRGDSNVHVFSNMKLESYVVKYHFYVFKYYLALGIRYAIIHTHTYMYYCVYMCVCERERIYACMHTHTYNDIPYLGVPYHTRTISYVPFHYELLYLIVSGIPRTAVRAITSF